jgi:hypothetical protein
MPRRIGRRRPRAASLTAAPVLGIAVITHLPAVGIGPPVIPDGATLYLCVLGYALPLFVIISFGVWGFRLGSRWRDEGHGGGGSKGPGVEPPPPPGGRELTDDFPAWEKQFGSPDREHVGAGRQE